jgi:hypothetical protein
VDSKASVPTSGSAVNTYYAIRAGRRFAESARPLNHTGVFNTPEEPPRSFIDEVQKQPHNDALTRYSDDVSRRGGGRREERSNSVPPGWGVFAPFFQNAFSLIQHRF